MRRPPIRPVHRVRAAVALALAVLLGALAVAPPASAATATFGSRLDNAPNVVPGCEQRPWVSMQDFDTYVPTASGTDSCTWWLTGVFGDQADTRKGYVPGDGTVTSVTIRSGATPAPLRVVVARQLTPFGPKAPFSGTSCCVFVTQSDEFQPTPNTTSTFPLNLPVEQNRNLESGIQTDDIVGISARSNTGSLPLFAIDGKTRQSAYTQVGTLDAEGMWPALGSQPNDSGGGRNGTGLAGFDVTAQFTWCDGKGTRSRGATTRATCAPATGGGGGGGGGTGGGGTGGGGGGTTGGGSTPVGVKVAVPRQTLRDLGRTGRVRATCTLDVAGACATTATVPKATARKLGLRVPKKASTVTVGSGKVTLKTAGTGTVPVKLTTKARKALRSSKRAVRIRLRTSATGTGRGAKVVVSYVTVKR
ncbi:hypothetical protein [Patulibacter minatonensis]|uniref:hypothetical protein n=1 Tax=Patulibacter minatonensis TaxID=298163 RepID=UPI000684D41D|nr:hypothetical protein [Patulibacter minatonensis]